MNTKDCLSTIQRIIGESLMVPASSIQPETLIVELPNIDSMAFELIVAAIENEAGRTIEPQELMPLFTVADLAGLLDRPDSAASATGSNSLGRAV